MVTSEIREWFHARFVQILIIIVIIIIIMRIWTKRAWNYSLISLVTVWLHKLISRHSFLQLFCVASYQRFNSITVFIVCMCDQTKPVGEINQVNQILALLCAADYGFIKTNSLLFSCTPLLCKLNSVSRQVYFSPLLFDILFIMLWTRWTF